jgi:two-component system chemotaxis response regulator CheB
MTTESLGMRAPPEQPAALLSVVVMAASAGGLAALSEILGALPLDFPAAIAVVQHRSPDAASQLEQLLARRTALEVRRAQDGDTLRPGTVYVAPPGLHLLVNFGGVLSLSGSAKEHYSRPAANPLFESVATHFQSRAIAVVLTGGDGDGADGVKAIKLMGGTVIAQDQATSQAFSMPRSAIATGDVDFILPLDKIGPKLVALVEGAWVP